MVLAALLGLYIMFAMAMLALRIIRPKQPYYLRSVRMASTVQPSSYVSVIERSLNPHDNTVTIYPNEKHLKRPTPSDPVPCPAQTTASYVNVQGRDGAAGDCC